MLPVAPERSSFDFAQDERSVPLLARGKLNLSVLMSLTSGLLQT